jgi:hypothetical protein
MSFEKLNKELFEMYKASMNAAWSTTALLQSQTERMMGVMLDQCATMQVEGRKRLEEWIVESKKRQEDMKSFVDEGIKRVGEAIDK